ncbi:all3515 family Zur-repressed PEP-CTERM protein [Bythopirellula goksoeyrii]|uniref:PEP-CTERM protein-sorting domain-containing protein n=1 Tax=Bythopirellula goksoeyrii TaxID=1400387 RepID=A0A5B9QC81_9BACT|nr:all3515 family Zur-repressed PEP-CTERM protein [Bythopirellula goksoeyrii]QEG35210.1 hypothetical protein Pr1d_25040 [Bythopirellula goksoeyrii]
MKKLLSFTLIVVATWTWSWPFETAQSAEFFVGVDSRSTPFDAPSGDGGGAYPDNPNHNRLTLLFHHGNHFHGIGSYSYSGTAATPMLLDTNGNNRIPETYTNLEPLPLLPGSGAYTGKAATNYVSGLEYSNLEMANVQSLSGVDDVLFNSSGGRWNGSFDEAHIHLQVLGVSSSDLKIGTPTEPDAFQFADQHVGNGNEMFSLTPVLWVDQSAPVGHYWAEFQLVDLSGNFGNSGRFFFDVQHVPEPTTLAVGLIGVLGMVVSQRPRSCRV